MAAGDVLLQGTCRCLAVWRMCREEAASVQRREMFFCSGPVSVWRGGVCVERRRPVYGGRRCSIAGRLSWLAAHSMCREEAASVWRREMFYCRGSVGVWRREV